MDTTQMRSTHLAIAAAVLGASITFGLTQPVTADVVKNIDRFNDNTFTTTYTANPGECSRINNKSTRREYQLVCMILSVTFKNSYDRISNLIFVDSVLDSRDIAQIDASDGKKIYLLLTMKDGTQKQLSYELGGASWGIIKNGPGKGTKARAFAPIGPRPLHDLLASYLENTKTLEFRFSNQEYIWKLNPQDVRRFLEVSAPAARPW